MPGMEREGFRRRGPQGESCRVRGVVEENRERGGVRLRNEDVFQDQDVAAHFEEVQRISGCIVN